jgi:hypothetical protein
MGNKNDIYLLEGFTRFESSKEEYDKFILNTKKDYYLTLNKTKDIEIYLEIQEENLKKIKNTVAYIFYKIKKNINFKITKLTFYEEKTKEDILNIKDVIIKDILNKIDDINYSIATEDLLDRTKFKYV